MLDPDYVLDAAARHRLIDRFGAEAGPWCDALPRAVDECCRRWSLELDEALSGGTSRVLALVHGNLGLVHGDLGLPNVLDAGPGRGLVAIDPRPCRGDRTVDAIDWAVGRVTSLTGPRERIERLRALAPDLNGDRLEHWCQATAAINVVQSCYRRPPDKTTRFLLQLAASVPG